MGNVASVINRVTEAIVVFVKQVSDALVSFVVRAKEEVISLVKCVMNELSGAFASNTQANSNSENIDESKTSKVRSWMRNHAAGFRGATAEEVEKFLFDEIMMAPGYADLKAYECDFVRSEVRAQLYKAMYESQQQNLNRNAN
ncbi:hypothetical protein DdX_14209 [Ditylenchus destructor]|uniref:Uncharacterized protein n=1 Tax=Ditylenchus destructor TaxID=166010 RepID=A0AAD4MTK8_9BILA|nr:hypothetical protein DdX_14209 [Ditylenchus destructor]